MCKTLYSISSLVLVGLDRHVRVLRWIVCCVFEGFLEVIVRHADHGDTLVKGYPGTQPEKPGGFWVGPGPGGGYYPSGYTRRYPGSKRTGGTLEG